MPPQAAVILPGLYGYGGMERYGISLVEVFAARMPVDVITAHTVDREATLRAFGAQLDGVRFVCDPGCDPPVSHTDGWHRIVRPRAGEHAYEKTTRPYDLVVAHTIGVPWCSAARRSILVCHFPIVRDDRLRPDGGLDPWWHASGRRQRDVRRRLASWDAIVTSSHYAGRFIHDYWGREARTIHPAVALPESPSPADKRPWIIGAGFFAPPDPSSGDPWSYKRQEILIDAFKALCEGGLRGWELHLAGHVDNHSQAHAFVDELRRRAIGAPVFLHPNCAHSELERLYQQGSVFWHATGYGLCPEERPERMEHFGIVTAEAMSWGCVPVVINRGGQPEIVTHGTSGFVWETPDELQASTLRLVDSERLRRTMAESGIRHARQFGMERFEAEVGSLIDQELSKT